MRSAVLAYLLGVLAIIGVGLFGLSASPIGRTPSAPLAVILHIRMPYALRLLSAYVAAHKERLAEPIKQIHKNVAFQSEGN